MSVSPRTRVHVSAHAIRRFRERVADARLCSASSADVAAALVALVRAGVPFGASYPGQLALLATVPGTDQQVVLQCAVEPSGAVAIKTLLRLDQAIANHLVAVQPARLYGSRRGRRRPSRRDRRRARHYERERLERSGQLVREGEWDS